MTVEKLIQEYKKRNPDGHFFDLATLKFFGERIDEMELIPIESEIKDRCGKWHKVWCLKSIQHNAPPGMMIRYFYFDQNDFSEIE